MPFWEIAPQAVPTQPGPETLHVMAVLGFEFGAGVSVAVYCALEPGPSVAGPLTTRVKLLVMLMVALAVLEMSATLRTVSVTTGGAGRTGGAVYTPSAPMVPQPVPAQPTPETLQVTAGLGFPALETLAVKRSVAPSSTLATGGATETLRSLATETAAAADLDASARLMASTVIAGSAGRFCGAV